MDALAVILEAPERLALRPLALNPMGSGDVRVEIDWSGISSGTEKLLWTGRMPNFPGMGYPLVPGYESVGRVVDAGRRCPRPDRRDGSSSRAKLYQGARGPVRRQRAMSCCLPPAPSGRREARPATASCRARAATAYHASCRRRAGD
jgi:3-hydroxyethyl bacteriochlorophyllide a dehydrogenase